MYVDLLSQFDRWMLNQADVAMGGRLPSEDEEPEYEPMDADEETTDEEAPSPDAN
ncbi:hypothetical protein [Leptolyngbya sp. FACHB-16]|uniref:hypothetical protein n=1 Tax=unclassified Leptolyngbya TaxID=2650499 RepID=UPI001688A28C|nr:hypothetical protein [Leptolyngbya sp. FACHB-16]MBD2156275.1 hypothetical protein [Leptolyngbya sp. FACHB-16]